MPDMSFVFSFVQENFPNVLTSRNGTHFNFRCPFCGDSKKKISKRRFHLQFKSEDDIVFNCFNCPASGNFYHLYGHVKGITPEEAFKELNKYSPDLIKNRLNSSVRIIKKKLDFENLNNFDFFLKEDCLSVRSVPNGHFERILIEALKRFIKDRKVETELFVCHKGLYKKRIIVPVFQDGHCVFFQGRRILEDMDPKYLNPSIEKENIIFNKDNFDKDKFIVVTEGIIDADSMGTQGTTCLGANISDEWLSELFKYTDKGVIVALDNDETGIKKMNAILKNSSYKKKLNYFFLEGYKDLNDLYVKNDIDVYKYVVDNMKSYLEAYIKT